MIHLFVQRTTERSSSSLSRFVGIPHSGSFSAFKSLIWFHHTVTDDQDKRHQVSFQATYPASRDNYPPWPGNAVNLTQIDCSLRQVRRLFDLSPTLRRTLKSGIEVLALRHERR